jgi:hypothetical protein
MPRSNYHGKRGSNAGDDFHELWAIRRALETIEPGSTVQEVTVEGVRALDEAGTEGPEWDGVDCAIYSGGTPDTIDGVEIAQLKYSGANPTTPWTISRLVYASNTNKSNSVIARLADAFKAISSKHPLLADAGKITTKLISNQPLADEVAEAISKPAGNAERQKLAAAANLGEKDFAAFLNSLDFSECGLLGRSAIEERAILAIAAWTDGSAVQRLSEFRKFVRDRMMPEGRGQSITKEGVLSIFGLADLRSLFPCPSKIRQPESPVHRAVTDTILDRFRQGHKKLCLHGQGGEGKTTVLQDLIGILPPGSVIIAYDCYGGGSYLNSDSYRHRPQDAFLQMANDACSALLLPLLSTRDRDADYPRHFSQRIERAAATLAEINSDALLVIAVDAADNAIMAARDVVPPDVAFVSAFLKLGDPPSNVRHLVSARTGRLTDIDLPANFERITLGPFDRSETGELVATALPTPSSDWLDDFHKLSGGNPRVQRYALDFAEGDAGRALAYLAPNGKNLDGIFSSRLIEARLKSGSEREIESFCAALTLLPRPVPIRHLAAVTGFEAAHAADIISDLRPGVTFQNGCAGFSDEDFESFVRSEGAPKAVELTSAAADHLLSQTADDAYAAEHVATVLQKAGRRQDILKLAAQDPARYPISDPALRVQVHERRMRAALQVCRETGDIGEALKLLLTGADALRTDAAVSQLLRENLDLAAYFSRDNAVTMLLRDPAQRPLHGPLVMQLMAADADRQDWSEVRSSQRMFEAWASNYNEAQRARRDGDEGQDAADRWELPPDGVAAMATGLLRADGVAAAKRAVFRARPVTFTMRVFRAFVERLARSGELAALSDFAKLLPPTQIGRQLTQAVLAAGGHPFDLNEMVSGAEAGCKLLDKAFADVSQSYEDEGDSLDLLELIQTSAELAVRAGAPKKRIIPILRALSPLRLRTPTELNRGYGRASDVAIRAFTLLKTLEGIPVTPKNLIARPSIAGQSRDAKKKRHQLDEQIKKASARIEPSIEIHKLRAELLHHKTDPIAFMAALETATQKLASRNSWYHDRSETSGRDHHIAKSLMVLGSIEGVDAKALLNASVSLFNEYEFPARGSATQLLRFAQFVPSVAQHVPPLVRKFCAELRDKKIPANDKIETMTRYARLVLPQDAETASYCFNLAVEVAAEIDAESVHALNVCAPLSKRAVTSMSHADRSNAARKLAAITKDVAERIGSEENFPWAEVSMTLGALELPFALAVVARFDELGLANVDEQLEPILLDQLASEGLSPAIVASLVAILEHSGSKLVPALARSTNAALLEEVSWETLFRQNGDIDEVASLIREQASVTTKLAGALIRTSDFLQRLRPPKSDDDRHYGGIGKRYQIPAFNWDGIDTLDALAAAAQAILDAAPKDAYITLSDVVHQAMLAVHQTRHADFLTLVCSDPERLGIGYDLGGRLNDWLSRWRDSPSAQRWRRDKLLDAIKNNLPSIARYIDMGQSQLPSLLVFAGASNSAVIEAILSGIEMHIDEMYSSMVYGLAGLLAVYAPASACASALHHHLGRRLARLEPAERALDHMTDTPGDSTQAVARFVFATLGSMSAPTRWRAAHAVRRLGRLGESDTVKAIINCYERTEERAYAHPEAPFHFLNARLWLMIALARSASEAPQMIAGHKAWLLEQGESKNLPHVLIREFAKTALLTLRQREDATLSDAETRRTEAINASALPAKKRPKSGSYSVFERYGFEHTKGRRFSFDTMDSLPYWFSPALRGFANPDGKKFLDRAEHWIVDCWNAPKEPHEIDKLRASSKFRDRSGESTSNGHGALPAVERYRSYLEFHAMHCAVGDFLLSDALAIERHDDWDRFDSWLRRQGLTQPPLWLSDLHDPKPLEEQFWRKPQVDETWLRTRSEQDVRRELQLDDSDWLVIAADHYERGYDISSNVRIESCLVSGGTATALRKALEASENSYQYRLAVGNDNEIEHPQFRMKALLRDRNTDRELDTHDRFRGELSATSIEPKKWALAALKLVPAPDGSPNWVDPSGETVIKSVNWSDEREYGQRTHREYHLYGGRLLIRRDALMRLLSQEQLELAVELTIRRGDGDRQRGNSEGQGEETEYDRIILFRQDGSIEATGQRLGRWRPHRKRTRSRGQQ